MTTVLRFQYRAGNTTSPVILRYGIAPPAVIPEPNITMAVNAPYSIGAGQLSRALKMPWRSGDITKPVTVRWSANPVTIKLVYSVWNAAPELISQQHAMPWAVWPVVQQQVKASWGGWLLKATQYLTSWEVWPIVSQQLQTTWLPTLRLFEYQQQSRWQHTEISQQQLNLFYEYNPDLIRGYRLPYGPRPPSYICSNDARPTRGLITLRFKTEGGPTGGPADPVIALRFSNDGNPVICVLDNGGGLIWPMPDLPTIDNNQTITPPRRRSYIMQPQLRCYRVIDNQEVNITSASWGISRSQWGANISLVCGSKGDKDLLFAAGPQEFKLVINGYEFFGLAEYASISGRFGKTTYTVTGRSTIAALASPHAAPRSYSNSITKGIAALMTDELTGSGWALNYVPAQFNVPAGVFSYQNKTPIEAIAQIAQAVGAMIYPDGATKTLNIQPLWPVTPWAMAAATPDIAVHDDVILQYSSQPASGPLFNKVIVRGEQQGISAGIRRTGTAGDKLAPEVVDALITDNLAARQRGTAELAESGNKDAITLVMPVMDLLPPCLPGLILGVTWQTNVFKALVDSVQITGQRSPDGKLTVRQSVGVLRSYE